MADIPYRPFATVEPTESGSPQLGLNTNASMFGGGIAQAVGELGQRGEQIAQQSFSTAIRFAEQRNETVANESVLSFGNDLGDIFNEYKKLQGQNRADALSVYQKKIDDAYQKYAQAMPNPAARNRFLTEARGYIIRAHESFGTLAATAADQAADSAARGSVSTAQAQVVNTWGLTPNSQDALDTVMYRASDYADMKGMTGDDKYAYIQKVMGDTYVSIASKLINEGNSVAARMLLDQAVRAKIPGTEYTMMSRQTQTQMLSEVERGELSIQARARQVEADQRRMEEDADKERASEILRKGVTLSPEGHGVVSPEAWKALDGIKDPAQWRATYDALGRIQKASGEKAALTTDVGVFTGLIDRMRIPEGSPGYLSNIEAQQMIGHGITPANYNFLISLRKSAAQDPMVTRLITSTLNDVQLKMHAKNDQFSIADPRNVDRYNTWLAQFTKDFANAPDKLNALDPLSKEYLPILKNPMVWSQRTTAPGSLVLQPSAGGQVRAAPAAPTKRRSLEEIFGTK